MCIIDIICLHLQPVRYQRCAPELPRLFYIRTFRINEYLNTLCRLSTSKVCQQAKLVSSFQKSPSRSGHHTARIQARQTPDLKLLNYSFLSLHYLITHSHTPDPSFPSYLPEPVGAKGRRNRDQDALQRGKKVLHGKEKGDQNHAKIQVKSRSRSIRTYIPS